MIDEETNDITPSEYLWGLIVPTGLLLVIVTVVILAWRYLR